MRVVVADDSMSCGRGSRGCSTTPGSTVVGKAEDRRELLRKVELDQPRRRDRRHPDAAHAYRRGPRRGAGDPRASHPDVGVLVSRSTSSRATRCGCSRKHPSGVGYLLKDRVSDIAVLADALRRIAEGECVIDPTIVSRLLGGRASGARSTSSPTRARGARSDGRGTSNRAICDALSEPEDVEANVGQIFRKLDLPPVGRRPPPRARRARVPPRRRLTSLANQGTPSTGRGLTPYRRPMFLLSVGSETTSSERGK